MPRRLILGLAILCLVLGAKASTLGGEFSLTADNGAPYSLADSRGKVVVMAFGYTFCPDVCPTELATIAAALNQIGNAADQVDALFVSLDPERDTLPVLHEYTRFFHPNLRGLTGEAEQLDRVADQYRVRYAFVGKGEKERYTLDHSASFYVIDTHGKLFRILPYGLPPSALADSLRAALSADRLDVSSADVNGNG